MGTIKFAYDPDRASHASLWLLGRHQGKLERLKLVKLLFLADRLHLARYGRPIVGGSYSAMPHGPVASDFLNALNAQKVDGVDGREHKTVRAKGCADEDSLSESDLEVLLEINSAFGSKDSWSLTDLTHTMRAWDENYPGGGSAAPMPYEDFFKDLDPEYSEILDIIKDDQEAAEILGA